MAPITTCEPLSKMKVIELTRLVNDQDDRWGRILTIAQSTKNPAAPAGVAFFKRTWRPAMTSYYENVAGRYDSAARAPERIVRWWLDAMSEVLYPAARRIGLPDSSFVFPDIQIDPPGRPAQPPPAARPTSPPMVATRGQYDRAVVGAEDVQRVTLTALDVIVLTLPMWMIALQRAGR